MLKLQQSDEINGIGEAGVGFGCQVDRHRG